ncbi:hypothetical protein IM774_07785 [Erysipelotrichaceae bacterium RD49]|nr:hypothetical protein [Erysipelotrichaceae bacterium RD49]
MAKKTLKKNNKNKNKKRYKNWTDSLPGSSLYPKSVVQYLETIGLPDNRRNFSQLPIPQMLNGKLIEAKPWEDPSPFERTHQIATNLYMMEHRSFGYGRSVLVYGVHADLYSGYLAQIYEDLNITVVSIDPIYDRLEDMPLIEEVRSRITFSTLDEVADQTFDGLLGVDLANDWLYEQPVTNFYTIEELTEKQRQLIQPKVKWLTERLKDQGTFAWLEQRVGTIPYLTWIRAVWPYRGDELCNDIGLRKPVLEFEDISGYFGVRHQKPAAPLSPSELSDAFQEEAAYLRESLIDAANNQVSAHIRGNSGALARFALEHTKRRLLRGFDLELEAKNKERKTVRSLCYECKYSSLKFDDDSSPRIFAVVLWSIPDDQFTIQYFRTAAPIHRPISDAELNQSLKPIYAEQDGDISRLKNTAKVISEIEIEPEIEFSED